MTVEPNESERYAERNRVQDLCDSIDDARLEIKAHLPASRAASLAMTKLQEAGFWLLHSLETEN